MSRNNSQQLVRLTVIALMVFVVTSTVWACPNCKEALAANDPGQDGLVKGYFYSILFMLGMPFTVLSCFSVYMYRQVLRARAQREAQGDDVSCDEANSRVPCPLP